MGPLGHRGQCVGQWRGERCHGPTCALAGTPCSQRGDFGLEACLTVVADEALEAVAFHTGVSDPVQHLRRLITKTNKRQEPMVVLCAAETLDAIDVALWSLDREGFVPHARFDSPPAVKARSMVALITDVSQTECRDRLVNLSDAWVPSVERFKRVVEVVTPHGAAAARSRWKRYAALGVSLSNTTFT